jgi:hypothetical protein
MSAITSDWPGRSDSCPNRASARVKISAGSPDPPCSLVTEDSTRRSYQLGLTLRSPRDHVRYSDTPVNPARQRALSTRLHRPFSRQAPAAPAGMPSSRPLPRRTDGRGARIPAWSRGLPGHTRKAFPLRAVILRWRALRTGHRFQRLQGARYSYPARRLLYSYVV